MSIIVSIHSFRGGTGKSNITASLGALLAKQGKRVGIVDTDIQSPGIHVLFGFEEKTLSRSINDYLYGNCKINDVAHDVTNQIGETSPGGQLWLIPASIRASDITRVLREGYDVGLLQNGFQNLIDELNLDALLIDTHPGLNEETLISITLSDVLLLILRPDQQDFQGTSVTVEVARRLEVPNLMLVLNKLPSQMAKDDVYHKVDSAYGVSLGAMLPLSEDVALNASCLPFVIAQPDHPWSLELMTLVAKVLSDA